MSRHWAFAALGLCGLLVLPACGSGGPPQQTLLRVASVVHAGPYTQVFASPVPAKPAQAAVVEGFREGMVLWDRSENAGRLVPPVRDYVTGQALTHLGDAMKANKQRDLVPAGTDRLFRTRVTSITGHGAVVATCDDGSGFKEQNPRTGKVDTSFVPTPGQAYLSETWRMVQRGGHWAITAFSVATLPSRTAEPCQPGMTGPGPSRRPTVAVLLQDMVAALHAARSVHVSGTILQGGKTLSVNVGVIRSGGFSGQISETGTPSLTVLGVDGHSYLKLSAAFLTIAHLPATDCAKFCGKYLPYPATESHKLFKSLSIASMTHTLASAPAREVKLLGAVAIGGQLAWLLQDSHQNTVYVAARGKPYILREVAPSGGGAVNLTQWNAVRLPGPPRASQVVSASQLPR